MTPCDKCGRESVALIRYNGAHLCAQHFCEFVEKRVKHELRKQLDLAGGDKVAVAVSGGKDSTVALHLIHKILGRHSGLGLCAITVDEGIEGYRESSIPLVAGQCGELGINHIVVSFTGLYSVTMDEIARERRILSACGYCGVLRRAALNRAARDWGAGYLATGLNLDDTAQSILMNFCRGDVERLARLGSHVRRQPGLVRRVQPLRTIPESETALYAIINKLRFHDRECPYAPGAVRNAFRGVVAELEDRHPGTRHSIVKSYDKVRPALQEMYAPVELTTCACGEPTVQGRVCKACELLMSIASGR